MLRGQNINSEAIIRRLIADMYQIQADIDEENETISDRLDRAKGYRGSISIEEANKLQKTYRKNEMLSEAIDTEIDSLSDVLDKIRKENN